MSDNKLKFTLATAFLFAIFGLSASQQNQTCVNSATNENLFHYCDNVINCDEKFTFNNDCICESYTVRCKTASCELTYTSSSSNILTAEDVWCVDEAKSDLISLSVIYKDEEKEENESHYEECMERLLVVECNATNAIKCKYANYCIALEALCDGFECCPNGTDEIRNTPGFKCNIIGQKTEEECVLPPELLHDDQAQCQDNKDKCYSYNKGKMRLNKRECLECFDRKMVVGVGQVCDGVVDCSDLSDECFCNEVRIDQSLCDVMYDSKTPNQICVNGTGELNGTNTRRDVHCGNGTCIDSIQVCDGHVDCPNGIDEKYCSKVHPKLPKIAGGTNGTIRCKLYKEPYEWVVKPGYSSDDDYEIITASLCDGIIECSDASDECNKVCGSPLPAFCSVNTSCAHGPDICDGKWKSPTTCGTRIPEEELFCDNRFYCEDDGPIISIPLHKVCDYNFDCLNGRDELNCTDGRFYCENGGTIAIKSGKRNWFVRSNMVSDGRVDCEDKSDECPQNQENPFSSNKEMISSLFFRIIIWPMAFFAAFGNIVVLIYSVVQMRSRRSNYNTAAKCHHLTATSLAISDLLMTVYLVPLAIKSVTYSGSFCGEEKFWKSSAMCGVIGTFAIISSEVSVLIMNLMAGFRLYSVYKPITAQTSKSLVTYVRILVILSWVTGILIGVIPWLPRVRDYFTQTAWVNGKYFNSTLVKKDDMYLFANKVLNKMNYEGRNTSVESIVYLDDVTKIINESNIEVKFQHWFGFYHENVVCLPKLFTTTADAGWKYTIGIITFNLIAFINVLLLYCLMIRRATKTAKALNAKGQPVMRCHMQVRVTRLLISDFLCWVPICILAYLFISGYSIPSVVYPISAIILLPINSSLNPILYSSLPDKLCRFVNWKKKKTKKYLSSQSCAERRKIPIGKRIMQFLNELFEGDREDQSTSFETRGTSELKTVSTVK